MFQGLRANAPIYILHKNEPRIEVGEVISVSNAMPQFSSATYQGGILVPPKNYVDVKVNVGGSEIELQKLPADLSIADFGTSGMVVSESADAMIPEVEGLQKISTKALEDVEHHKKVLAECESIMATLNPRIRKEAEQAAEIEGLKRSVTDLRDSLSDIRGLIVKALGHGGHKNNED